MIIINKKKEGSSKDAARPLKATLIWADAPCCRWTLAQIHHDCGKVRSELTEAYTSYFSVVAHRTGGTRRCILEHFSSRPHRATRWWVMRMSTGALFESSSEEPLIADCCWPYGRFVSRTFVASSSFPVSFRPVC